MAAINLQTADLPNQVNASLFEMNANQGFILKPACMSEPNLKFNPFELDRVENVVMPNQSWHSFALPKGAQLVGTDRHFGPNAGVAL